MKLNKEGKDELRARIIEQLKNVPEGQRVHLDKDLIEELLFEEITIYGALDGYKNSPIIGKGKIISWSGEFLQKIDLSEISFEDVIWRNYNFITEPDKVQQPELFSSVNLSNTNVNIDFSKSFEAKHPTDYYSNEVPVGTKGCVSISNINFSGVDLSQSNFDYVGMILDTNLDYTKAPIRIEEPSREMRLLKISCSSLKGIDLSQYTINAINLCPDFENEDICFIGEYIEDWYKEDPELYEKEMDLYKKGINPKRIELSHCNLQNTGLNIVYGEIDKAIESIENVFPSSYLSESIKNGSLEGCYVNGKKVLSKEESQGIAQQKREEYEKFKEDLIGSVSTDIENQVSSFKR